MLRRLIYWGPPVSRHARVFRLLFLWTCRWRYRQRLRVFMLRSYRVLYILLNFLVLKKSIPPFRKTTHKSHAASLEVSYSSSTQRTPEGRHYCRDSGQCWTRQEILNNHDQKFLASAAINKRHELQPRPHARMFPMLSVLSRRFGFSHSPFPIIAFLYRLCKYFHVTFSN